MKIFITGITGFLGSHLTNELSKHHTEIYGVSRDLSNPIIKEKLKNAKIVHINELESINEIEFDYLIHCATNYGRRGDSQQKIYDANFFFPIETIKSLKVKTVLNIDTFLDQNVNEYSFSKNMLKNYIKDFLPVNFINFKVEHLYGIGDSTNKFIYWIIKNIIQNEEIDLTDGKQIRDFVHVQDVTESICLIINQQIQDGEYEMGSGNSTSVKSLITFIHQYLKDKGFGQKAILNWGAKEYRANELLEAYPNITPLKELGKTDFIEVKEGILPVIDCLITESSQ